MDSSDKQIRYSHENKGLCKEIYENVTSVSCVSSSEGDSNVIIIGHDDDRSNTVLEDIDELFSVKEIKTV